MSYLDELKRQAEAARASQSQDIVALQRNAMLTDAACQSASRYLRALAQQLNVLQPASRGTYRFDSRTSFSQLKMTEFRTDARQKRLRDADVFDHIVLHFDLRTGQRIVLAKDFPPEIEKIESKLRQCGAEFDSEVLRDPNNGHFLQKRFELLADFHGSVRLVPDHDAARIDFLVVNLEGFETVTVGFPAFEVGTTRLDELARWIVGEPNAFLRDGLHLRRVAA